MALPVVVNQPDPCAWGKFLTSSGGGFNSSGQAIPGTVETVAQATLLQKTEHALCEAEHWLLTKPVEWWGDLWAEIRGGLDYLWSGLGSAWDWVENKFGAAKTWTQQQLQALHDKAQQLLAQVKASIGTAGEWLLIGLAGLAALYFLPEIIDGLDAGGTAYARRYRKSVPRAYRRIKARHG